MFTFHRPIAALFAVLITLALGVVVDTMFDIAQSPEVLTQLGDHRP